MGTHVSHQAIANQRSRKKRVDRLLGPNGAVEDQTGIIRIAVNFYQNLFGAEKDIGITLGPDVWGLGDLVTQEENEMLCAPFSKEEIKEAVFSSYSEGAPSPDGLPFLFYQKF
jgi:hypothetical protein